MTSLKKQSTTEPAEITEFVLKKISFSVFSVGCSENGSGFSSFGVDEIHDNSVVKAFFRKAIRILNQGLTAHGSNQRGVRTIIR